MTFLSLDTESGDISPEGSLLSLTLAIVNSHFEHTDVLTLNVKPDPVKSRTQYTVCAEAMNVNKIDLIAHDKIAIPYREAKSVIYNWLQDKYDRYGTLTPFGNNVQRDIDLICFYTLSEDSWNNFCDRRVIELSTLGKTCQYLDLVPKEQSLSLSKMAEYFGVETDSEKLHTSDYDTWIGSQVLKGYLRLLG